MIEKLLQYSVNSVIHLVCDSSDGWTGWTVILITIYLHGYTKEFCKFLMYNWLITHIQVAECLVHWKGLLLLIKKHHHDALIIGQSML